MTYLANLMRQERLFTSHLGVYGHPAAEHRLLPMGFAVAGCQSPSASIVRELLLAMAQEGC